jgi:hypothetical protein
MSDRTVIRKIEVSIDRKFPTTIEYGKIVSEAGDRYYLLHGESRHWDENLFVFETPEHGLKAMGLAAANLGLGLEVPRLFDDSISSTVKF